MQTEVKKGFNLRAMVLGVVLLCTPNKIFSMDPEKGKEPASPKPVAYEIDDYTPRYAVQTSADDLGQGRCTALMKSRCGELSLLGVYSTLGGALVTWFASLFEETSGAVSPITSMCVLTAFIFLGTLCGGGCPRRQRY